MAERFPVESPPPAPRARVNRGSAPQSSWAVEQRLASTERELRIQFTRIAQLQAELDMLLAALKRAPRVHMTGR
ncbi:MAG TPA: hypothetical protein VMS98_18000 [Thermoanaerobaculia bacterium]|nr:hypothetical protein [Thermoanaerobaculia bacterium]